MCIFSIYSRIYRATMPISANGLMAMALIDEYIYVGGGEGKVKKLHIASGKWTLTHEAQLDSKIMSINANSDKKELIVGTINGKLYRMLTHDLSFMMHTDAHTGCISDIHFMPNRSDQFLCIDSNGVVKLWDLSEYKALFTIFPPGKESKGQSCTVANDDLSFITGWRDGSVRCYDPAGSGRLIWDISTAHRGAVTSLYADQNYIATGGEDGAVRLWARTTRKLLIQFTDAKRDIVAIFPDLLKPYQIHSCSLDRTICTYDLKQEKRVNGHQTKNGSLYGMTQRKDHENELVTCGQGAPIYFWDCDESAPVAEIAYPYKVLCI